jgi:hypothetical protein
VKTQKLIKFNPAQNKGEAVPVLITVPLALVPPPPGRAVRRAIRREDEGVTIPRSNS